MDVAGTQSDMATMAQNETDAQEKANPLGTHSAARSGP
jgi:hypothetical protein